MPNPATHIEMAFDAAQLVNAPVVNANMGHYLLGATAPDVRVITKKGREPYHFAPLDFDKVGAGMRGLLDRHPELIKVGHGPTRAFVAGYIAHLVLDETWITEMYRRYFGAGGIFASEAHGAVMDRAMQLELDSIVLEDFDERRADLARFDGGVDIPFIDAETLADWHQWVTAFVTREFSWERLRFMARRIARGDDSHPAHRIADEFVVGMPGTLDTLHEAVPKEALANFKRVATAAMARNMEKYLA